MERLRFFSGLGSEKNYLESRLPSDERNRFFIIIIFKDKFVSSTLPPFNGGKCLYIGMLM